MSVRITPLNQSQAPKGTTTYRVTDPDRPVRQVPGGGLKAGEADVGTVLVHTDGTQTTVHCTTCATGTCWHAEAVREPLRALGLTC